MTINNNLNYVICDIPPAIYISYIRLKIAFPNKKISLLIDINDKDELQKNIKSNDISFVFPQIPSAVQYIFLLSLRPKIGQDFELRRSHTSF